MSAVRKPVLASDLSKATSQRNNSQWAPLKEFVQSPAVLSAVGALSALPPITPWTAGLKLLGVAATTLLVGDLIVEGLKRSLPSPANASAPSAGNGLLGGVDHVGDAKAKSAENQSKRIPVPSAPLSSAGSLLDVLSSGSTNTNKVLLNNTEVIGSHFSFFNEQFGAHLLYMDALVTSIDQISQSLQVIVSASIDSLNKTSPEPVDYSAHLEKMANYSESAKVREDFLMSPQTIEDLEGNPITTAHPEQLKAQAHANATKFHSDTNNDEYNADDLPLLDLLPIIPFFGVSSSFDKSISISENPFLHKIL